MEEPKFTWYFGYGSNMNQAQLKSGKQISPLESYPAHLDGWRLVFNLKPILNAFGCMGNIREDKDAVVHGVLHKFTLEDLEKMDKFEMTYKRVLLPVTTYDGKKIDANVYIIFPGHPQFGPDGSPSQRYKSILLHGAKSSQLKDEYIKFLDEVVVCPFDYDKMRVKNVPTRVLSREEVRNDPMLFSFMGHVFDLSNFESVRQLFNASEFFRGKAREYVVLRLMPAEGDITPPPVPDKFTDMTESQLDFLDTWLHAMELEWPVVGTCPLPVDQTDE
ncbi:gamma-glutamylcyclotransferase [Acrasis kona]|uniref:gamma-glutamylcyclotransferase n=1 Tax=Acrasis kona TaxID=1008807 RepID=A0AAW2Z775_9EUKA